MKKITLLAILGVLTLNLTAQNKFGYIDSQELLQLMPERKTAETEVQNFAKSLEAQLGSMTAEYQQSLQEYQANEANYTDLVKQDKEAEINALTEKLSDGDFYKSDPDGFVEMTKELKLAKDQLEKYEERWLELEDLK